MTFLWLSLMTFWELSGTCFIGVTMSLWVHVLDFMGTRGTNKWSIPITQSEIYPEKGWNSDTINLQNFCCILHKEVSQKSVLRGTWNQNTSYCKFLLDVHRICSNLFWETWNWSMLKFVLQNLLLEAWNITYYFTDLWWMWTKVSQHLGRKGFRKDWRHTYTHLLPILKCVYRRHY